MACCVLKSIQEICASVLVNQLLMFSWYAVSLLLLITRYNYVKNSFHRTLCSPVKSIACRTTDEQIGGL